MEKFSSLQSCVNCSEAARVVFGQPCLSLFYFDVVNSSGVLSRVYYYCANHQDRNQLTLHDLFSCNRRHVTFYTHDVLCSSAHFGFGGGVVVVVWLVALSGR